MYQFYNAHPKGLDVGDCVKRAISKTTGMDYMDVQRALNRYKKVTGAKSFNSDRNCDKYVEEVLKAHKLSFPARAGQKRMNGQRFCESYSKGHYILRMAGHWTACIDGVIYDTWDCSDKCVYNAWLIKPCKTWYTIIKQDRNTYQIKVENRDVEFTTDSMSKSEMIGYSKCLKDMGFTERGV